MLLKVVQMKIEWKLLIDGTSNEELIQILWDKLNEVIRYINKED